MAGEPQIPKTISELTELENPQSTDVLPISRGQNTDKITAENLIGKTRLSGLRTTDKTVVGAINEAAQSGGSSTLDGLDDVDINTPTDGQTLQYDGTTEKWKNVAGGGGGASALEDLTDVDVSTPTDGQLLGYNGTTEKWENVDAGASALEELTDVDITTPQDGDTLVYDSENDKWVNGEGGGGSAKQVALTQAEYDALVQAGTVDPTMEYFITDGIPYSVAPWTDITGTLTAGQTSLVFSNAVITTNSTIDIYVDDSFYGVNPTAITLATGSVTLTFDEQESNMPVKVRIS